MICALQTIHFASLKPGAIAIQKVFVSLSKVEVQIFFPFLQNYF